MTNDRNERDFSIEELKRLRDELQLQMHLASAEAKDEWAQLEEKWKDLNTDLRSVGKAAATSMDDIGEAAKLVVEEIVEGYERIKKVL